MSTPASEENIFNSGRQSILCRAINELVAADIFRSDEEIVAVQEDSRVTSEELEVYETKAYVE